jgi:hypothetical protein
MFAYAAPWSRSLTVSSVLATILCLGLAAWTAWGSPGGPAWIAVLPVAILIVAALFTVRG